MIFRTILSTLNIGLMMYGRARWHEAEATRKDFNTVLTRHVGIRTLSSQFQTRSTQSTIHSTDPQQGLALWEPPPFCPGGGPHGWVPVNTHSTPMHPKWEEAVG